VIADDLVLERAQQGDRLALEELCRREWPAVYGLAYHALGLRTEAQDLTQEVFVRALRSLPGYRASGAPFGAWLATIARNLLRDRWRAARPAWSALTDDLAATNREHDPEAWTLANAEAAQIRAALDALPADYQTVLRLRILEGRSTEEVAGLLDRSPAALRQLQHRAIVALRSALIPSLEAQR
jgi:RNA polymerase sigma-70 factor, ECF subfamily